MGFVTDGTDRHKAPMAPIDMVLSSSFADRLPIQVVVVTAMHVELRTWIERFPLGETLAFPQGGCSEETGRPLSLNRDRRVLGVTTGQGPFCAATTLMALGHDGRFDLRDAYWLMTGIAGIDPQFGSIGSVVLPRYLVGLGRDYYLDGIGVLPRVGNDSRTTPNFSPPYPDTATCIAGGRLRVLDQQMIELAHSLYAASGALLNDTANLQAARARYTELRARDLPTVYVGGTSVTGETFWAGRQSTVWARNESRYFTAGAGELAVTQEEDIAWYEAVFSLARELRPLANVSRVVYVRSLG